MALVLVLMLAFALLGCVVLVMYSVAHRSRNVAPPDAAVRYAQLAQLPPSDNNEPYVVRTGDEVHYVGRDGLKAKMAYFKYRNSLIWQGSKIVRGKLTQWPV